MDEDELIQILNDYFAEILKNKKNVIRYVTNEFQRVYKAKDKNVNYEKELNIQLARLKDKIEIHRHVYR